jgi:TPR repeat protein
VNYVTQVEQSFELSIKLNPNFVLAFVNRGGAYAVKHEYDRAIRDLDQAVKLDPNFAAAFYQRGNALRARGQESRAAADFAKARQLNSNPPSALPAPSPSMAKFLSTPEQVTAAQAAAINAFKRLEDCDDVTATPIPGFGYAQELGVPQFDAAGNLSSGAITEHFATSGCGKHRVENIVTLAKDGKIAVVPSVPETTQANPILVQGTLLYVHQAAAARTGNCKNVRLVDTSFDAFDGDPNPRAKFQENGGRPWREIWTLDICGSPTQVTVRYIPDETGTTIVAGLTTPQAPPVSPPAQSTVAASHSSVADLLERGRKAHAEKNYREEMRWFRKAADQGNAAAQNDIGGLYANRWACLGMTPRPCAGSKWRRPKNMPRHKIISVPSTRMARACRRTTPRRCAGTKWRQRRDLPRRKSISGG